MSKAAGARYTNTKSLVELQHLRNEILDVMRSLRMPIGTLQPFDLYAKLDDAQDRVAKLMDCLWEKKPDAR